MLNGLKMGLAALIICVFSLPVLADIHGSADDAIKAAKKDGKPVMLFFATDWCHYCHQMKTETLGRKAIQETLEKLHYAEVGEKDSQFKKWHVGSYPTTILLDKDGKEVKRQEGFMEVRALQRFLNLDAKMELRGNKWFYRLNNKWLQWNEEKKSWE